jgi:hypothetical protein
MVLDWRRVVAVAYLAVSACGPAVRPEPDPPIEPPRPVKPNPAAGKQILLGEMCPVAAAGRPGIAPLIQRGVQWTSDPDVVADPIAHGTVGPFAVIGFDGARAGVFETMGVADAGLPQEIGAGSYVGASPCTRDAGGGQRAEDPACTKATKGCGLAIADATHGPESSPPAIVVGGGCVAGDTLAVDVDGDKKPEHFPIGQFLDGVRAPAEEVVAAPVAAATCQPQFAIYGLKLAPGVEPGGKVDPRYQVDVDVLGIADLDGDGRREIVLALRYPDSRTIAVYSATASAGRLDLVGESVSWP